MRKDKSFIIEDENLMKEWNWERNNILDLNPNNLTFGSSKKAWWKCERNHNWFAPIYRKVQRNSCPFCSNRRILSGYNDLATLFPQLLEEWNYDKNKDISPNNLSINSTVKINWKCKECKNEWETVVRYRTIRNAGCPKCSSLKNGKNKHEQSLRLNGCLNNKLLLRDWDYSKNNKLPNEYTKSSNEKVWWKCAKCGYGWQSKICNRTNLKRGCPCCANHVIVRGVNDISTVRPELMKEWHPTKNLNVSPYEVAVGSRRKIWWLCPRGHEYQASLLHRKHGTGCPICKEGRQTSFAEQCVFYYLKQLYPDAINKFKADWLGNFELDIFIPSINYAIEYDGAVWHKKETIGREQRKYKMCNEKHIKLVRLREEFAELGSDIANWQIGCKDLYKEKNLEPIIRELLKKLNFKGFGCPITVDIEKDRAKIREYMQELKEGSFADMFPELAKEWALEKNGYLKPTMFKPYSTHKVWWICPKCKNEYQATISSRSYGTACKKCGMEKLFLSNARSVEMIDPKTQKTIKTFESISKAAREMSINSSNISMVCNGNRKHAGGYCWRYEKKG